jgi:putative oxidoreductase
VIVKEAAGCVPRANAFVDFEARTDRASAHRMPIFEPASPRWASRALSVLRVFAALILLQHGTQKMFGFPVVAGTPPQPFVLASLNGVAGVLEVCGGIALLLGMLTRPIAFLLSGEMAFAYFLKHAPRDFWPIVNRGEVPVLLCFVFLYFAFAGGGAWSLDAVLGRSRALREPRPAHGPPRDHGAKRAA